LGASGSIEQHLLVTWRRNKLGLVATFFAFPVGHTLVGDEKYQTGAVKNYSRVFFSWPPADKHLKLSLLSFNFSLSTFSFFTLQVKGLSCEWQCPMRRPLLYSFLFFLFLFVFW